MTQSAITGSIPDQIKVSDLFIQESREEIIAGIYRGLREKQKFISSRFFYDERGSKLFRQITELPEYYLTRKEILLLQQFAQNFIESTKFIDIVELGSGDCSKISILLDGVPPNYIDKIRYIPVDVSSSAIIKSAQSLLNKFPSLNIHALIADFTKHLTDLPRNNDMRLICFLGSTIGNFNREKACELITDIKKLMNPGNIFLLGIDMVKDIKIIEDAYNDKQGITSAFNKNILNVVNHYAKTDFDPEMFEHMAFYNRDKKRIEMHLKALQDMSVNSPLFHESIFLKKYETIHTENSHKFTKEDIFEMAEVSGLIIRKVFVDMDKYFSLVLFECP